MVTGGASGMGEATCHELGRRGLKVAVLDVNEQRSATGRRRSTGARCDARWGSAPTSPTAPPLSEAFAKVRSELGPVAVLVTSAGLFDFWRLQRHHRRSHGRGSSTST